MPGRCRVQPEAETSSAVRPVPFAEKQVLCGPEQPGVSVRWVSRQSDGQGSARLSLLQRLREEGLSDPDKTLAKVIELMAFFNEGFPADVVNTRNTSPGSRPPRWSNARNLSIVG
jgi:hypothetical protein